MGPALFAITLESMKAPDDEVALQGIEFWSSVCDEEVDLQIEAQEAQVRVMIATAFYLRRSRAGL